MSLTRFLPTAVLKVAGRPMLHVQKHSPIILFVAGTVGAVGSTVMACKATLKLEDILTESEKTLQLINDHMTHPDYSEKDIQQDKIKVKVQTGVKIAKLYAPALGLGLISIGALTGSHYIMSSRQAGLMAAYAGLDKAYQEYQARVRDELGVDREEQLRHGSVQVKTKDDEGKVIKTQRIDPNATSIYARFFDETANEWQRDPEYNLLALKTKQQYANNLLHAQGHLFLNDVYKMLGIKPSKAGQVVGWVVSEGSDNFVDFGFMDGNKAAARDFVNGNEGSIFLDFNVDGPILNKI